jgi:uncharacterized protein (TIGR02145 family)
MNKITVLMILVLFSYSCSRYDEYEFPDTSNYLTFTDARDGQTYKYIKIGNQYWMAENLNYNTGSESWVYDNDSSNATTYGRLYNWETACTVCPNGWHLPNDEEWTELIDFLGGERVAGGKMKEKGLAHWVTPNAYSDNSSGFTGLPGGYRVGTDGLFVFFGKYAHFWSATEFSSSFAYGWVLTHRLPRINQDNHGKSNGLSVRCLKD